MDCIIRVCGNPYKGKMRSQRAGAAVCKVRLSKTVLACVDMDPVLILEDDLSPIRQTSTHHNPKALPLHCRHELGTRWNYLLALGNIRCSNATDPSCGWVQPPGSPLPSVSIVVETIEMVNANPDTMGFEYYLTRANNRDMQVLGAQ